MATAAFTSFQPVQMILLLAFVRTSNHPAVASEKQPLKKYCVCLGISAALRDYLGFFYVDYSK